MEPHESTSPATDTADTSSVPAADTALDAAGIFDIPGDPDPADAAGIPVLLTMWTLQQLPGELPQQLELSTDALWYPLSEDSFRLCYEESSLTGMEGSSTVFQFRPGELFMTRSGSVNSQMLFVPGQPYEARYQTPYGEMEMFIQTVELQQNLTVQGGTVSLQYDLRLAEDLQERCRIHMRIRPKLLRSSQRAAKEREN